MTTKIIPLKVREFDKQSSMMAFTLPSIMQQQCCGYVELYISPAPPQSKVTLNINDLALGYQQCPTLQSDGSSMGIVKMLTDEGPMFFSPDTIVSLQIFDPTTQIVTSGYRVSAKVVCYPEKNCDKLYNIEHPITLYTSGPCTKNKTTGAIICPDGYCVSRVFSANEGMKGVNDPSKQPHVTCPCAPEKFVDCSKRCHANSTCVIGENKEPGVIQYGTCSGCSKIGCVFTGAGI